MRFKHGRIVADPRTAVGKSICFKGRLRQGDRIVKLFIRTEIGRGGLKSVCLHVEWGKVKIFNLCERTT